MTKPDHASSRSTTFAVVERIASIEPHVDPNAQRIEVIVLSSGVKLVTGKHYRAGDLGVYIRPGCIIPGLLAEQLWLVGKRRASTWFEVRDMPIGLRDSPPELKVQSPGLWAAEWYMHDNTDESHMKADEFGSEVDAQGFRHWKFWRSEWAPGATLDGHFGIVEAPTTQIYVRHPKAYKRPRRSSAKERSVVNREVAGSSPAAGSLPEDFTTFLRKRAANSRGTMTRLGSSGQPIGRADGYVMMSPDEAIAVADELDRLKVRA